MPARHRRGKRLIIRYLEVHSICQR